MDEKEIIIITRDINGGRRQYDFPNQRQLALSHVEIYDDEEEILLVLWDGICIYNALDSEPITWEDIAGFFA